MSVGEALAEARGAAGLSVDEVSERTAIREIVIRSIERDDFDALGGDLYVRGYLRKIAGAVGIDPRPLIREFDARRPNGSGGWSAFGPGSGTASAATGASEAVAEPVPAVAPDADAKPAASADWPGADAEPAASADWPDADAEPAASVDWPDTGGEHNAAEVGVPASSEQSWFEQGWTEPVAAEPAWADPLPHESADRTVARPVRRPGKPRRPRPLTRVRGKRWVLTISGLTIVVLAVVGVAAGEIISKVGSTKSASATAAPTRVPTAAPSATAPLATPSVAASTPASKPTPTPTTVPPTPVRRLRVQADGAFGPDGLADGDNPQSASFAITSGASAPWQTNWYATADFGLLKHGTGLLLDMGKRVTITSVTIELGSHWGANLQLRAGDEASLSRMSMVASATDVGGQLTMKLKQPARARYVLIWFAKLPPSGDGTYMGSVYSVMVKGRP